MTQLYARQRRAIRYIRTCQHCSQEIVGRTSFFNYWYSLLCRKCFNNNAVPLEQGLPADSSNYQPVMG